MNKLKEAIASGAALGRGRGMNQSIEFWVPGLPRPKGSHVIVPIARGLQCADGKRYLLRELAIREDQDDKLKAWTRAIQTVAVEHRPPKPSPCPWDVTVAFRLPRPQKPKHPAWPIVRPDADKLVRAILDALTGWFWADDSQVVSLHATKLYADTRGPGASIRLLPYGGSQIAMGEP